MLFSWYIIAYLFLAGAGSGAFLVASACCVADARLLTPQSARLTAAVQPAFYVAPALMVLAVLFLFADLGFSPRVILLVGNPFQSIMSMGAWMVALLTIISVALALSSAAARPPRAVQLVCMVGGSLVAVGTMTYTGLLLCGLPSVDFWGTGWLPALFVVSSVSCGTAVIVLADAVLRSSPLGTSRGPWHMAGWCLLAEALALAAFMASRQVAGGLALESARLLILGELAPTFLLVPVGMGLVLPAALHLGGSRRIPARTSRLAASVGVLAGGLGLRYCLVAAALLSPLTPTVVQIIA